MRLIFTLWLSTLFLFAFSPTVFAFPARYGLSPDNSTELVLSTLETAKKNILVNIYQFENQDIADKLVEKINAGVTVQILIEGTPVGRMSPGGKRLLSRFQGVMKNSKNAGNRLLLMTNESRPEKRRFRWNHAKYLVIDGTTVLVSSENFTTSGHPQLGTIGNRGWDVAVESPHLAEELTQIFKSDSDAGTGDIVSLWPSSSLRTNDHLVFPSTPDSARNVPAIPLGSGDVQYAKFITSPQALKPLQDLLRSAKNHLELEQMSFPSIWRDLEQNPRRSPFVNEVIEASARGVKVRVLLNDETVFSNFSRPSKPKPNEVTVQLLKDMARCYRLPIEAQIVDIKRTGITYIHNKGILVDGQRTLVSSINGTQNSMTANREVALLLESESAASYFGHAFDFDWENSKNITNESVSNGAIEQGCPPRYDAHPFGLNEFLGSLLQ